MTDTNNAGDAPTGYSRGEIAKTLIWISVGGLVAISLILILATAYVSTDDVADVSQLIFNALLPLFGTWVGAIVAFYFSSENFKEASKSVQDIAKQSALGRRLRTVSVREAMLPKIKIKLVQLTAAEASDESKVELKSRLIDALAGPVSRIPVLNPDGSAKYIVHESLLFRFSHERALAAATGGQAFDLSKATLKDFLDHEGMRELVSSTMAFVAVAGTLADAKAAMDKISDCRDVFVTAEGSQSEPIQGWITNTTLESYAQFE